MKKDLHAAKKSHITFPITKGIEIHLQNKDIGKGMKPKVGKKVVAHIPFVTTSTDKGHHRFIQTGKLTVHGVHENDAKIKRIANRMKDNKQSY